MNRTLALRWQALWTALGAAPPPGSFEDLRLRYGEPQRHYHTLLHLEECFACYDSTHVIAVHPHEVAMALWFHDAVYDVRRHDNEAKSAQLAAEVLGAAGLVPEFIGRVEKLILATRHHIAPAGTDEQLLVEIDLAILATPASRFDEYERHIRAEYAHVPDALFAEKRAQVLRAFLRRPSIYSLPGLKTAHEEQARANLRRSLKLT